MAIYYRLGFLYQCRHIFITDCICAWSPLPSRCDFDRFIRAMDFIFLASQMDIQKCFILLKFVLRIADPTSNVADQLILENLKFLPPGEQQAAQNETAAAVEIRAAFLLLYNLLLGADPPDQLSLPEWKLNTAPSLMPDGQRAVTVFSLV